MKKILLGIATGVLVAASVPFATTNAAPYCGITWGSLPKSAPDTGAEYITNVRTGRHDCYDRMVVDLSAGTTGYDVRYVDNVYTQGEGALLPLSGGAKLEIIVHGHNYNIATGAMTYPARAGQALPGVNLTGYQTFRQAKWGGSQHGDSTIGLGVRARLPYRVIKLDNRVVIDVAHYW